MSQRSVVTIAQLSAMARSSRAVSDWIRVDQEMIDAFARVTGDDAFIHTDPVRAAKTRFRGTIAHGLLTLSLLPLLMRTATPLVAGMRMGVNAGFDRVRFTTPVPVDSRVRARVSVAAVDERKPGFFRIAYDLTVEIEGIEKPALTARWLLGLWVDSDAIAAPPAAAPSGPGFSLRRRDA